MCLLSHVNSVRLYITIIYCLACSIITLLCYLHTAVEYSYTLGIELLVLFCLPTRPSELKTSNRCNTISSR